MKLHTIIITRDRQGGQRECMIWPDGCTPLYLKGSGVWVPERPVEHLAMSARQFKAIFRFLPRKGTKIEWPGVAR